MGLSQISVNADVTWQLAKSNTGFTDTIHGTESASFSLTLLDTDTWNELFAAEYTIAAAGTQAVDLRTFTDLAGNSVATADKALAIIIIVTGAAADLLNVKKHGTNGLQWFFGGASEGVNIPGGGMLLFSEGSSSTGTTVDASNKQLLLTNNGAASLTVKVVALLSDA